MEGRIELVPEVPSPPQPLNVLFVDDDAMFREVMATNLADEGVNVRVFETGQALLDFVGRHGTAGYDALLLDLKMPGIDGIGVLRRLRAAGVRLPAVFLTLYNEEAHEQAALDGGAVDFVDKTRNVNILATRLRIIALGAKTQLGPEPAPVVIGDLTLHPSSARALWKDRPVVLTVTQFRIIQLLASRADQDISYREIYDTVHGAGFAAGDGELGYRVNVRSLIKRIRRSFEAVDSEFDAIANYPAFGYRWRATA